jgi:hypothetical protein
VQGLTTLYRVLDAISNEISARIGKLKLLCLWTAPARTHYAAHRPLAP